MLNKLKTRGIKDVFLFCVDGLTGFRQAIDCLLYTSPGGCNFGVRPIDQHLKGFEAMGAVTQLVDGAIIEACLLYTSKGYHSIHSYMEKANLYCPSRLR